jgi:uncharacterized protein (DUF1501 family)
MATRSHPSRRDVLRWTLAGTGIAALGPTGRGLSLAGAAVQPKRMVVVYLEGGCDTLNLLIPRALPAYFAQRPTLAIPDAASLSLAGGPGTTAYRLHPKLPLLRDLWNTSDVAFVHRAGYPDENLSHFESMDIYGWAVRAGLAGFNTLGIPPSGWLARLADHYAPTPLGAVSIGMGKPTHFVGAVTPALQVGSLESFQLASDWHDYAGHPRRRQIARDALGLAGDAGLEGEVKTNLVQAHDLAGQIQQALADHQTALQTGGLSYPDTTLGRRLSDASALIRAGFESRAILTATGGYDTHGNQGGATGSQANLFEELDGALGAFVTDLKAQALWNDVVVCVYTEFGRRNYENGSTGTDHGGAYEMILLGGPVNGGLYGPDLVDADLQGEYATYAVDFRDVFREVLAEHLGMDPAPIFPEAQPPKFVPNIL